MEKLERRMRQALLNVDERVARVNETAVVEKSKKMLQKLIEFNQQDSKKAEKPIVPKTLLQRVQQALSKVDERIRDILRLGLLLPCLRVREDDGEVSGPASASQRAETDATSDSDSRHAKLEGDGYGEEGGVDSPAPELGAAPPRAGALRMDMASRYIPDHDEDAFFCHPGAGVVGVADGVGGYRKKGVDAGAFARALIASAFAGAKRAAAAAAEGGAGAPTPVCPYALLRSAYEDARRSLAPGASTAAVVSLDGETHTLQWACIGDSGFAVLRGGRIVRRSVPQQHCFNCPYQLSATGADRIGDADVGSVPVVDGDVVVIGTDGLFDNVFDVELEQLVRKGMELGLPPQEMADNIATTACEVSFGWLAHSPSTTSTESWRNDGEGAERFYGGKVDDVTVIVAFISLLRSDL